ncbi:MAG TPA: tetratricopeptide repeat protein [Gaiellaceae bacterium]
MAGRLDDLAYLALREGERERARELGRRAVEVAVEAGDVGNVAGTTQSLGDIALEAGDPEAAEQHYRGALRMSVALPHEDALLAACCAGLAAALARQSRGAEAGRCRALADRVVERAGIRETGTPVDYRAHVTAALGAVGTAVYDAAYAAAQSVPLDDAIAEVGSAS